MIAAVALLGCAAPVRVGAPCAPPAAFAPFDQPGVAAPAARPVDGWLDALVVWYQRAGRADSLPGVGCPFAPTCSVYARTAIERYGPLAVILIVDRLFVREHELAAAYYPPVCVARTVRLVDEVP